MSHEKWPPRANYPAPTIAKDFQNELTKIAGKAPNGLPILKVFWAQDEKQFFCGEQRSRYIFSTEENFIGWEATTYKKGKLDRRFMLPPTPKPPLVAKGVFLRPVKEHHDIGIPRWMISQYVPPELACIGWELERYNWIEGERIDVLGPEPREGMYHEAFYTVADHRDG